ncbi:MAG: YdiU family protein [Aestuariibacter sp.]
MLNHFYAKELSQLVSKVQPQALQQPQLVLSNESLYQQLQLPQSWQQQEGLLEALFAADGALSAGAVAQKYGGHQFGQWNPDIGDGRGLLLGEVRDKAGAPWDLHLKGAGQTPYSRFGDGRAVLRSTIREYVISESLHALGIPTSRALCLISSQHPVQRESLETGAMLIRVCASHLRFGHFEYFHHTGDKAKLESLFDFVFKHHFPQLLEKDNSYLAFLQKVISDTADLIAKWQAFGFCHGVMNTDNMSIHGISFDFGPFAFLDQFIPDYICNHSDHGGRYAFDQQPGVALWNLHAFAQAFFDYVPEDAIAEALKSYEPRLIAQYKNLMQQKFGFATEHQGDASISNQFMQQLAKERADFTQSFRALCHIRCDTENSEWLDLFQDRHWAAEWLTLYVQRLQLETHSDEERHVKMRQINPKYIPRNYLIQQAIVAAQQQDFAPLKQLLEVMMQPFDEQQEQAHFARPPAPEQVAKPLSCSS